MRICSLFVFGPISRRCHIGCGAHIVDTLCRLGDQCVWGLWNLWQCPGGEILPIRIKLVILRNNSVSLVECRVINSGSEIPCHKLASISTKFRVINFMTRDSRHGIKILWKFSKKSLHRGFWGEKIKLSKNPCMGTLRGHIRRCSCKGDNFFWKLLPKTLGVRFLHNKIVLGILEIFFVLRIFFWK